MKQLPLIACLIAAAWTHAAAAATATPVMTGLDNPRGLAFGPQGALYVAEAGRGGSGPCTLMRNELRCYGPTGAVSRLWKGRQQRVILGLPSYASASGVEAVGPHDIGFNGLGEAMITIGLGADPAVRTDFGDVGALFGSLLQVSPAGRWRVTADISAYEAQHNPAGGPVDTNPYGVLVEPGRSLITDAGANAVYAISANGALSLVATLRSRPDAFTDSVPTAIARGPDGAYYVSELTGAPFLDGWANVYRMVPGKAPSVYASGLKTVIDLAFGPDGSLYVLQYASGGMFFSGPGQLWRIATDGSRSLIHSGLSHPTSVVVAADGTLYVSNRGAGTLTGEVLRIDP